MATFNNKYESEVKERWGDTDAYKEYAQKTVSTSINDGLTAIMAKFADCMQNGHTADSSEAQTLVSELQAYITANYYTCTNEILAGLGQMYVCDERFKTNIDSHATGTAEFVSLAIKLYCSI